MDRVRLGIIGCGLGSLALYAAFFRFLENGELVACMDVDEERAREYQQKSGAPRFYTDLDALLEDREIDAVMILTPPNVHAEQVVRAAAAGKHVYCEKPMAPTLAEADRMIAACRQHGVKLQIAFMKRFNQSFNLGKRVIDDGRLGEIFEMRAVWDNARAKASAATNYRHQLVSGGGYLQEDGSHPVDVCRWWLGDVAEVTGHVMRVASNRFENDSVDLVVMKHGSGALSSLHITMLSHRTGIESYEVFGTKGTMLVQWLFHSTHSLEPALIHIYEKSVLREDLTLYTSWDPLEELVANWQYLNELRHFCDCVLNDHEPAVGGAEGRAVVEILNAAYVSAWEKRTIILPLDRAPDFEAIFREPKRGGKWDIADEDTWWSRY